MTAATSVAMGGMLGAGAKLAKQVKALLKGSLDQAGKGGRIFGKFKDPAVFENNAGHIFRNAKGPLPDSPVNRKLLSDVSGDKANFLGTDKYGSKCYSKILNEGTQVWAIVREGKIRNGGLNQSPKGYNFVSGLSRPEKDLK